MQLMAERPMPNASPEELRKNQCAPKPIAAPSETPAQLR
jgi:hypothetical protein